MKKLGVFIELSNIYHTIALRFNESRIGNRRVSYEKYIKFLKDIGNIVDAYAYGTQKTNEAEKFIKRLEAIGFTVRYKSLKEYSGKMGVKHKADWDVGIVMDIVQSYEKYDMIVLGTADGDFRPLVEWLVSKGKQVLILACGISKDLKETATSIIEIPESLLERRRKKK
jgi:uncharacterized LabA/DUF88 family protein